MDIVDVIDNENAKPKITKMTIEEAEELFYQENDCLSDDVDSEQARVDRWIEEMNIKIIE